MDVTARAEYYKAARELRAQLEPLRREVMLLSMAIEHIDGRIQDDEADDDETVKSAREWIKQVMGDYAEFSQWHRVTPPRWEREPYPGAWPEAREYRPLARR